MNVRFRDPFDMLRPLAPSLPWHWAIWGAAGAVLALLFMWSLGWMYGRVRTHGKSRARALAIASLAAISWPVTVAIIAVLYAPAGKAPAPVRRSRRFWVLVAGTVAALIVACVLVNCGVTGFVLFAVALVPVFVTLASLWLSTLAVSVVLAHTDSPVGMAVWGMVVLGMLALSAWRERRAKTEGRILDPI
jgi:hypothetical protein